MRVLLRFALTLLIFAATYTGCGSAIPSVSAQVVMLADQGVAFNACSNAATAAVKASSPDYRKPASPSCVWLEFDPRYDCQYLARTSPTSEWFVATCGQYRYPRGKTCKDRAQYNGAFPGGQYKPRSGSVSCDLGCTSVWTHNADGTVNGSPDGSTCTGENYDSDEECKLNGPSYYYNRQVGVCEPQEPECKSGEKANSLGQCAPEPCPEGMTQNADGTCKKKDTECPAGHVRSPDGKCLPGDGQCAAGEVRGPDGTCKRDSDNDGEPDEPGEGDKDTFSGGDDCNSPPSCSGSPILCGQARIQWRIECNTRKNRNIAGGTCSTMPICTGERCDALEYSGLLMQWRAACALEKLASAGNGGTGEGSGDLKAIRDALTGTGGAVNPGTIPGSDAWVTGTDPPIKPDTSGYGWGGTCPSIPAVNVMGTSMQFDPTPLCNWLSLGSYFVLGLAALASLRIVATRDS